VYHCIKKKSLFVQNDAHQMSTLGCLTLDLPNRLLHISILHKMGQPKCERRHNLRVFREERSSGPAVGRWEQLIQSFHLARRQDPSEYSVVCCLGRSRNWCCRWCYTHPLHEEYLASLGGRYVRQRLSCNPSAPDWPGLRGCRHLLCWSGE
jgi:hypothetical protein